jgi:hypothetical protein
MPEVKDLTEEEVKSLKELNDHFGRTLNTIGDIEIKLNLLKNKQKELEDEKNLLLSDYSKLREKESEISKQLLEKYGEGTIDLNSGKIELSR